MQDLPNSIFFEIFSWLPISSLPAVSLTCKAFHKQVQDDFLWKRLVFRDFGEFSEHDKVSWKSTYQSNLQIQFRYPPTRNASAKAIVELYDHDTVLYKASGGVCVLLGKKPFSSKKRYHFFEVKVLKNVNDSQIGVGVGTERVKYELHLGGDEHGWSLHSGKFFYAKSENKITLETNSYQSKGFPSYLLNEKEIISVLYDYRLKTVHFIRTGAYAGRFVVDIDNHTSLFPAITLTNNGTIVKVMPFSSKHFQKYLNLADRSEPKTTISKTEIELDERNDYETELIARLQIN